MFRIIVPLYFIASVTSLNFSTLLDNESELNAKTCSKYLTPPCINLVDLDDVPDPKSFFYITSTLRPRVEASMHTPAPLAPPPMITIS